MRDVAVVSFAQSPHRSDVDESDAELLFPVVNDALERAGMTRADIGFTCSGSADYLTGGSFTFVATLEVAGAWPPIAESHVEMDGAWALYEAWVRLQHGDIDAALVYSSGISSRADLREVLSIQLDPYYLAPLWPDHISLAALQARALLAADGVTERSFAEVAARSLGGDVDALLAEAYVVAPLRDHDCPVERDGAAAIVLAAGDAVAASACTRPAWITGIDHRVEPHYPGVRDLATSPSTRLAGERAGVFTAPVEVAELHAPFSSQEVILRRALDLDESVDVNPSGGALANHALMTAGLVRIGEAFRAVSARGCSRALGHATSGPCLQQNLVCVVQESPR